MTRSAASAGVLATAREHRALLKRLCLRDLAARYRSTRLGMVWALLTPLLMLAVYTLVFGVVFQARWGTQSQDTTTFALMLYSGLIVHQFVAEVLSRSVTLVVSHANYVKKVVFPLPLLSMMAVTGTGFNLLIQLGLLLLFCVLAGQPIAPSALALPLILVPLALCMLGVSWAVASLGVYLRDLEQVMGFFITLLLFLSPIFYPAEAIPESFRFLIHLNPLTWIIEPLRGALFHGAWPAPKLIALLWIGALIVCRAGFWWFERTRHGFADVL